ncbi:ATP-binding protein [Paenibacillus lemnae]|uniref:Circadian input-output histidine kinase CikA n=1 Tax=Paenibacillus lemnae TaxID=1330551 RepID=A0A848M2G4_PAELE|nr:ATP-binding protein [Paenibacillus lemnae]NMO95087.1 hypothetical protein [Paenibacillus lemnae]
MTRNRSGYFRSFDDAAAYIIELLAGLTRADSIFIATNDGITSQIVKSFNRDKTLAREGSCLPYEQSFSSLVKPSLQDPLVIHHLSENPAARNMDSNPSVGDFGFAGVPISYHNGDAFGTLCMFQHHEVPVSDQDLKILSAMSVFLSYVIELDRTVSRQMNRSRNLEKDMQLAEEQVEILQAEAHEANDFTQSKSDFLATMTHEIRNSINGTIGMTDLLQTTDLTEEQEEYLQLLQSSNEALLDLTNNLLDYSKLEAGKAMLDEEPFDIVSMTEDLLYVISPRAFSSNIEVVLDVDKNVPTYLLGDASKVRQILLNFLSNALKFTHEGEIVVTLSSIEGGAPEDTECLHISIRDTGVGIEPDKLNGMFQRYQQLHRKDQNHHYGGTGLGLAIANKLIQLMDGKLNVKSQPGHGTTIELTLYFKRYKGYENLLHDLDPDIFEPMRVLIADDNETSGHILGQLLTCWGIQSTFVQNGMEAQTALSSPEPYDLILLDRSLLHGEDSMLFQKEGVPVSLLAPIGTRLDDEQQSQFSFMTFKPIRRLQLYNALIAFQRRNML